MTEQRRPLNEDIIGPFLIADIDTASQSQKLPAPFSGQVVGIKCCVADATVGATANGLTVRKDAVAMTGITLAVPASDAGAVITNYFSPNNVNGYFEEDDALDIATDGLGTSGGAANVYLIVRR